MDNVLNKYYKKDTEKNGWRETIGEISICKNIKCWEKLNTWKYFINAYVPIK